MCAQAEIVLFVDTELNVQRSWTGIHIYDDAFRYINTVQWILDERGSTFMKVNAHSVWYWENQLTTSVALTIRYLKNITK